MNQKISTQSVVVVSTEQISCELRGEAAILDLKSGTYFGLDEVGATVWSLIAQPRRVSDICNALIEQYDVEPDRCGRELLQLLGQLHSAGLIRVSDEADT